MPPKKKLVKRAGYGPLPSEIKRMARLKEVHGATMIYIHDRALQIGLDAIYLKPELLRSL